MVVPRAAEVDSDESLLRLGLALGLERKRTILVVGDGDLGYASCLAKYWASADANVTVYGTTYESEDEITASYPNAAHNVAAAPSLRVRYGVDATRLSSTLTEKEDVGNISRIVWNFPHYSEPNQDGRKQRTRKRNFIHKHRALLESFFSSAAATLAQSSNGIVYVTLVGGQGGTPADPEPRRKYGDTWQIVDLATRSGFILQNVHQSKDAISGLVQRGYTQKGYRQGDRAFATKSPVTHVFQLASAATSPAAWAVAWRHDIGFWIDPQTFTYEMFAEIARRVAGDDIDIQFGLLDRYVSDDGKHARTYSMIMSSRKRAFSKIAARDLALNIRTSVESLVEELR